MRAITVLSLLVVSMGSSVAHASSFMLTYENRPSVDPAENFEADCLGATEAPDCASRAAALSSELVELLSSLEGRRDADTIALFQTAVSLKDPKLAEIGMRYFSYHGQTPPTVWDGVKEFFFGTDPGAAGVSAELLTQSTLDLDIALGEQYLDGRPSYGSGIPSAGVDDGWAAAQSRDALIEAMLAFEESEQFTPATRLLMNDRMLLGAYGDEDAIPVTGFVTDSSVADVTAFFTALFKKAPYPSLLSLQAKLAQLEAEIEALTEKLQSGDQAAGQRLTELVGELTPLQLALSLAESYEFEDQQCTDHVFWTDAKPEDVSYDAVPRAVAVGPDRLIGRTAIRYINGLRKDAPRSPDDDPDAGPGDDQDGGVGDQPDGDGPGKKGSGGCSTRGGGENQGPWWLSLLALLALARTRRRHA